MERGGKEKERTWGKEKRRKKALQGKGAKQNESGNKRKKRGKDD